MPIPDYQTLMLPVLRAASDRETRVPEVEDHIADLFNLSEDERNQLLPSGRQKILHNRIHWAKFYLSKAGLLETPRRGRFVASDLGRQLLSKNPEIINNEMLLEYPTFKEFLTASRSTDQGEVPNIPIPSSPPTDNATPEEQIDAAYGAVVSALRSDLLARILQNSAGFFENVIVELLVAMGYGGSHQNAAAKLGRSGDGGVDGVINEDRLGLDRVYIQAKRYAVGNTVGRPEVQAFLGSLVGLGATKGVFVTTSTYSSQAIEFVNHLPQRIILIDGQRMADLMIEYNVGVRVNREIVFKRIDEDFFSEDD